MLSRLKLYLIALLSAATLCVSLIAYNQSQRIRALEAELASAKANTSRPSAPATPAIASAETATPAPEKSTAPKPPAPAVSPTETDAPPAPGDRPGRAGFAALMSNPEFAKAMNLQQRAALDARYADLFKQLNLSPAALERFKDLLVERQNARMDVMMAARETGLNPRDNREEIQKLVAQAQADVDANIKAALGDTAFNQYQTYETTQPQRSVVSSLDQRLAYSGTPLSRAQSDLLVQALGFSSTTDSGGMPGPGGWGMGNRATITDEVIQKAQGFLSSDQVAALKQLRTEQDAQQQMRNLMRGGGGRPRD